MLEVSFRFETLPTEREERLGTLASGLLETEFLTWVSCTIAAQPGGGPGIPSGDRMHLRQAAVAGPQGEDIWTYHLWRPDHDPPGERGAKWVRTNWIEELLGGKGGTGGAFLGGWAEAGWEQFVGQVQGSQDFADRHSWWLLIRDFADRISYLGQQRAIDSTCEREDSPAYSEDGRNAVAVLHSKLLMDRAFHQQAEAALKAFVMKELDRIDFEPSGTTVTALLRVLGQDLPLRLREVGTGVPHALAVWLHAKLAPPGGLCLIEEPELHLHPAAQDWLLSCLRQESGHKQVIVATHSPAVAGQADAHAVHLVSRGEAGTGCLHGAEEGAAERIGEALGVRPQREIAGCRALTFVEGPSDAPIVECFARTLRGSDELSADLDQAKVALIHGGGSTNLRSAVSAAFCQKMGRPVWVVLDRHADSGDPPSSQAQHAEKAALAAGAKTHIWRNRSIENYFHPHAVATVLGVREQIGPDDVPKKLTAALQKTSKPPHAYNKVEHGKAIAAAMSADQILERDQYRDEGQQRHEVRELLEDIIRDAQPSIDDPAHTS